MKRRKHSARGSFGTAYGRPSTSDQNEYGQVDGLCRGGATEAMIETVTGVGDRPEKPAESDALPRASCFLAGHLVKRISPEPRRR
jgi:hypothetical protein